jgi:threonine synthase
MHRIAPTGLIERYRDRLPVTDATPVISLGEGSTPLLRADRLGAVLGVELYLKLEGMNPTGSFKDRGMTMALSKAAEDGAQKVVCASTGNTSASAAAYAARAGIPCLVVVPSGQTALGKLAQAQAVGATVCVIDGSFDDGLRLVRELCDRHPITLVNNLNDYRLEGQKTAAFEIVDEIGVPDWLVLPVGNAGNITAYWRGFNEAVAAGDATDRPRLLGCQAAGSAAMLQDTDIAQPQTVATAIRIGSPVRRVEAARAARESEGGFVAAPDEEILDWWQRIAQLEGVFCEPSSATSVAGLARGRVAGTVAEGERVVCVLTGHGLKDPDTAVARSPGVVRAAATFEALERIALS